MNEKSMEFPEKLKSVKRREGQKTYKANVHNVAEKEFLCKWSTKKWGKLATLSDSWKSV